MVNNKPVEHGNRFTFRYGDDLATRLGNFAGREGLSIAEAIRVLLTKALDADG